MTIVTLHIGAFKTGTSYLQSVLDGAREALSTQGVLWPGRSWQDQQAAARGLIKLRPAKLAAWDQLVEEIDTWSGDRVVVSMKALSMVSDQGVEVARRVAPTRLAHRPGAPSRR